jgi:hypothetical protein
MPSDRDAVLLETVKTHRARLVSALLYGELDERRLVVSNVRRLIVGFIIAAVACAGCAGTSFVISVIAQQQTSTVSPSPTPIPTETK